jgi:hypothetical protein
MIARPFANMIAPLFANTILHSYQIIIYLSHAIGWMHPRAPAAAGFMMFVGGSDCEVLVDAGDVGCKLLFAMD